MRRFPQDLPTRYASQNGKGQEILMRVRILRTARIASAARRRAAAPPRGRLACMLLLALLAWAMPAAAQPFPDRPLTIINPYATGSQTDAVARALADSFSSTFGQPVVVVNREGGSGVVGMRALMASPADGHTLAFAPMVPLAIQPHLVRNTGLSPDAVAPVCNVTENLLGVMVRADAPWRSLPELAKEAQRRSLAFGSPGPNSAPAIGVARLREAAGGGDYVHVPFRADSASLLEVKAGRLDFAAIVVASGVPMARAGEMRLLGTFALRRHPEFPDVPTAREQGLDAVELSSAGLFVPRSTPGVLLDQLEAACRAAMDSPGLAQVVARWAVLPEFLGRADFARRIRESHDDHGAVLRGLGVVPE
jgi:tripartite-type tricarboxylate transporter receptor subunit TctC